MAQVRTTSTVEAGETMQENVVDVEDPMEEGTTPTQKSLSKSATSKDTQQMRVGIFSMRVIEALRNTSLVRLKLIVMMRSLSTRHSR